MCLNNHNNINFSYCNYYITYSIVTIDGAILDVALAFYRSQLVIDSLWLELAIDLATSFLRDDKHWNL